MPYLSIIIPIYNMENAIERCIKSVLAQTYTDFEVLLIDDGSKDNSGKICESLAFQDIRLHYIKQDNHGVSYTRNQGINWAKGQYLLFIDSDDCIPVNFCEAYVQAQREYGVNSLIISSIKRIENDHIHCFQMGNKEISLLHRKDVLKLLGKNLLNSPVNKIYNVYTLRKYKILFDETISIAEDLLFNLRYLEMLGDSQLIVLNHIYYEYIITNTDSLSMKYHDDFGKIHDDIYLRFWKLCIEWNVPENDYIYYHCSYWWLLKRNLENTMMNGSMSMADKIKYNNQCIRSKEFRDLMKKNRHDLSKKERLVYTFGHYELFYLFEKMKRV